MKKLMLFSLKTAIIFIGIVVFSAFITPNNLHKTSGCSEWQRLNGNAIEMRWCTSETGEVTHQFYNGYNFQVHFYYKFDCSDGRNYTGNIYLDGGAKSDMADMMKSKPSYWYITKKERKGSDGRWEIF